MLDLTTGCGGEGACPRQSDEENNALFLRVSSWSYNTELGFHYLANVLNRNTCFSQGQCAPVFLANFCLVKGTSS